MSRQPRKGLSVFIMEMAMADALKDLYLDNEYEDVDGVEILNTYWNTKDVKFDAVTFDEFIRNFEKYKGEKNPHVKIDHTSQQAILKAITGEQFEEGTELPNLGFIKRMYHDGKSMFADITKVPAKLKEMIFGGKMFKAISPEATWNYRGTGDKLITALAMTNNPAQKHVLDVHMSEHSTDDTSATGAQDGTAIRFSGDILIQEGPDMAESMKDQNATAPEVKIPEAAMEKLSESILEKVKGMFSKKDETDAPAPAATPEQVVSLSEYNALQMKLVEVNKNVNSLNLALIDKDKAQKDFSERIKAIEQSTRIEKAEAICKQAILSGVPTVVVNHFKPVLLSEVGENTIKLSEKIGDKIVEADKMLVDLVKGFFEIYPNKVDFNERTATRTEEPGLDEDMQMSEINKKAAEYVAAGMTRHEALEKAGVEILAKKGRN
jgi:hypothetical protein